MNKNVRTVDHIENKTMSCKKMLLLLGSGDSINIRCGFFSLIDSMPPIFGIRLYDPLILIVNKTGLDYCDDIIPTVK